MSKTGGKRPNCGRKKGPYSKPTTVRLRPEHRAWLAGQPGTISEQIDVLLQTAIYAEKQASKDPDCRRSSLKIFQRLVK